MKRISQGIFLLLFSVAVAAQNNPETKVAAQLTETSVVKDTSGTVYPFSMWRQLLMTGHYDIWPENPASSNSAFIITRLTDKQYEEKMSAMPKPAESKFFKTGAKFAYFNATDLNGNKISSQSLAGKIVVLNYWFIGCPPCRMEIPELNNLADEFRNDTSIVFIAVALDQKAQIKDFLKVSPFKYNIVGDGQYIALDYNITSYPTNLIVDHEGKIFFHSSGLSTNTVYWLKKSIAAIKQNMPGKKMAMAVQ